MKINSILLTIIVILLVAGVSYYIGVSKPQATQFGDTAVEIQTPKWEYGLYVHYGGISYMWTDASKNIFSTEHEDFNKKMGLPSKALLQDLLNLLGTQGWELACVSVEGTQQEPSWKQVYYFKRHK
jgi:hypothetical protein